MVFHCLLGVHPREMQSHCQSVHFAWDKVAALRPQAGESCLVMTEVGGTYWGTDWPLLLRVAMAC